MHLIYFILFWKKLKFWTIYKWNYCWSPSFWFDNYYL